MYSACHMFQPRLVLSLEREGARVFLSSLRSKTAERLLLAHGVIGEKARRSQLELAQVHAPVFSCFFTCLPEFQEPKSRIR